MHTLYVIYKSLNLVCTINFSNFAHLSFNNRLPLGIINQSTRRAADGSGCATRRNHSRWAGHLDQAECINIIYIKAVHCYAILGKTGRRNAGHKQRITVGLSFGLNVSLIFSALCLVSTFQQSRCISTGNCLF